MATIDSPTQPSVSVEVEPTFKALRTVTRPLDYIGYGSGGQTRVLGHYKVYGETAAFAPSANVALAAVRWSDLNSFAVIQRIYLTICVSTAVTAQAIRSLQLIMYRGFTSQFTTNAAALGLSGSDQKVRANMSSSLLGTSNIQLASASSGMSGGVFSTDDQILAAAAPHVNLVGLGTTDQVELYRCDKIGEHPIVLAANEGFAIRWGTVTLASGTLTFGFGMEWAEVPEF